MTADPSSQELLFRSSVRELYAHTLDDEMLCYLSTVFEVTERSLAAGPTHVSHGSLTRRLALGLGMSSEEADRIGTLFDALQPIVDLVDNITDRELDHRAGKADPEEPYAGVPREVLYGLPTLMMACVTSGLFRFFPADRYNTPFAAQRFISALGKMTYGQGQDPEDPARIDNISGHQGLLFCLPLWLLPDPGPEDRGRMEALECWAFEYGRVWQLSLDFFEDPGCLAGLRRLNEGLSRTRAAWPGFDPFLPGQDFSRQALLSLGASR